jgi:hypothetical protein
MERMYGTERRLISGPSITTQKEAAYAIEQFEDHNGPPGLKRSLAQIHRDCDEPIHRHAGGTRE